MMELHGNWFFETKEEMLKFMPPQTFEEGLKQITDELTALMISKQNDYGHGNILAFGEQGVLVRTSDKMERLKNLLKPGKEAANEKLEDTWADLANYAIIALMLRRGTFTLPLAGKLVR